MKRLQLRLRTAAIAALMIIGLCSTVFATSTVEVAPTRQITDGLGRLVDVPVYPERIVAAGGATLMVADALYLFPSVTGRMAGISRIDQGRGNFLAEWVTDYSELPVLERNVGPEQVAAVHPDVVILKSFMKARLGDKIEALGIPVVYVELETPDTYRRDLTILGDLLREDDRAADLIDLMDTIMGNVIDGVGDLDDHDRPEVLFVYADVADGSTVFNVPPASWIQTELIEMAGGRAVWAADQVTGGWLTITVEQIAAWDPEHILLVSYRSDPEPIVDRLKADPVWMNLTAVKGQNLRSFPVDYYSWDQPDVRWLLGLQWVAKVLHPTGFTNVDVLAQAREFFASGYQMSDDEFDRVILPVLTGEL